MGRAKLPESKFLLAAVVLSVRLVGTAQAETFDRSEIQRGFEKAVRCIKGGEIPSQWCGAFHNLVRESAARSTDAFLLGANFGFSFVSETAAEQVGADHNELLRAAKCALTARVDYERIKKQLHLTDADISRILKISPKRFAAWKARASTNDGDRSIDVEIRGIDL